MPEFEIHDDHTGLKVLAEGPTEPTQADAQKLINEELSFLSTNLYHAPGNRFMLDVGPLSDDRRMSDRLVDALNRIRPDVINTAIYKAADRISAMGTNAPASGTRERHELLDRLYEEEKTKAVANNPETQPSVTHEILNKMPKNTLLLISHGEREGGLTTDYGDKYTLQNVATLLGKKSNDVQTIINTACYGGRLCTPDYQSAFPNAVNIVHGDTNLANLISLNRMSQGDYFYTNVPPVVWRRTGTNWSQFSP